MPSPGLNCGDGLTGQHFVVWAYPSFRTPGGWTGTVHPGYRQGTPRRPHVPRESVSARFGVCVPIRVTESAATPFAWRIASRIGRPRRESSQGCRQMLTSAGRVDYFDAWNALSRALALTKVPCRATQRQDDTSMSLQESVRGGFRADLPLAYLSRVRSRFHLAPRCPTTEASHRDSGRRRGFKIVRTPPLLRSSHGTSNWQISLPVAKTHPVPPAHQLG